VALRAGEPTSGAGWGELAEAVQDDLAPVAPDCRAGVTTLGRGGALVRLLCPTAPALSACVAAVWARCRLRLLGLGPLGLRKL